MTASPVAELCNQVAGDVGLISRAWAASRGNHHQQAQVAAVALLQFLQNTDLLVLLHADSVVEATETATRQEA